MARHKSYTYTGKSCSHCGGRHGVSVSINEDYEFACQPCNAMFLDRIQREYRATRKAIVPMPEIGIRKIINDREKSFSERLEMAEKQIQL